VQLVEVARRQLVAPVDELLLELPGRPQQSGALGRSPSRLGYRLATIVRRVAGLDPSMPVSSVEELAREFDASRKLIEKQLENAGVTLVDE
jgi:hypothetical protein